MAAKAKRIAKVKAVVAEEQQRKVEMITAEGHQLVEKKVVAAAAAYYKAILEAEATHKVEVKRRDKEVEAEAEAIRRSPVKEKGWAKGERVTCN